MEHPEQYQVTKEIDFCYGHRLLNYNGKCKYLHGHNAKVEITLQNAALDERGMVVDFVEMKRSLQTWIDASLDHKMILNEADPLLPVFRQTREPVLTLPANPTAENLAKLIFDYARSQKLPVVQVKFWETASSYAAYRA